MATVSGVPVQNITGISGVDATSITAIAGIPTSTIPGWPSAGPSCTTIYLGYSDGRRQPPSDACLDTPQPYDYDNTSGILYQHLQCGVTTASPGFYSDGSEIYDYTNGVLVPFGPCGR